VIYVGVKDNEIWLMGGPFGSQPSKQGTVAAVKAFLDNEKIRIDLEHGNSDAAGDYDLRITGTVAVTVLGFPVSTPLDVTIRDIKAPNGSDIDDIEDAVRESLEDVGTVSELKVVLINNSADRITFDLEFKGTVVSQGVTVNSDYKLRYDYTK